MADPAYGRRGNGLGTAVTLPPPPTKLDPNLDLYPHSETDQARMVAWCNAAFQAADDERKPHQDRWERYYKLYRSYVRKRRPGDWRSRVFYPVIFWVIETILPRLVGQLPKMLCIPIGPEDVWAAHNMETLLLWSAEQSELYLEQVKAAKSALMYGTGIIKTRHRVDQRLVRQTQQVPVPGTGVQTPTMVPDPLNPGQPLLDANGYPISGSMETYGPPQMASVQTLTPRTIYDGPAGEAVDIFNFWPAPDASDIEDARYVIHRVYRDVQYLKDRVAEGVYRIPENMTYDEIADTHDEPWALRLRNIEMGGYNNDPTRQPVELQEFWTQDGRCITLCNRKCIVRCSRNPYDHGEKPFVRVVDHLVPHEFWGIGEVEPLEGLQDLTNALVNQRVDNVRMTLQSMFAVNTRYIENLSDLNFRPGGVVRVNEEGLPPRDAIHRIEFGDVTQGAFEEASATEGFVEKVSGVTAYQLGTDSPLLNRTATGVAILNEQGNTRFSLKTKLAELLGMKRLARHFGTIIQQFMTEPAVVRILGPDGSYLFQTFDPASIQGGLDYTVETESTTQTESARKDQAMTLFQVLAPAIPQAVPALAQDVLREFGVKDMSRYLGQYMVPPIPPPPQQMGQLPPGTDQSGVVPPEPTEPGGVQTSTPPAGTYGAAPGAMMPPPMPPPNSGMPPDQQAMQQQGGGLPAVNPMQQLDAMRVLDLLRRQGR